MNPSQIQLLIKEDSQLQKFANDPSIGILIKDLDGQFDKNVSYSLVELASLDFPEFDWSKDDPSALATKLCDFSEDSVSFDKSVFNAKIQDQSRSEELSQQDDSEQQKKIKIRFNVKKQ
ncbi:hypothetical protein MIR68_008437 [Amoeboaphelidium protococcarum]|nr:hypothetical protein MIR68_008437 [Amoeboaphelidium protococcarum]